MKQLLAIPFFLLIGCNAISQTLNRDTVSVRWIRVPIDATNNFIVSDSSSALPQLISAALRDKQDIVFLEHNEIEWKVKLYPKIDFSADSIRKSFREDAISTNLNYDESNSLCIAMDNKNPLCYEDASSVIIWCDGVQGLQCFVYPSEGTYIIPLHAIKSVRIREEKQFNEELQQWEFVPIGISFWPTYGNNSNYQLWFDLSKLKNATTQTTSSLAFILQKKYTGDQYMQLNQN